MRSLHLACSLVGAHLQADGRAVHGGQGLGLMVVQVSPGAVCVHARLAS